jgi:predicted DsbA family dithiol-disulfide isomerase
LALEKKNITADVIEAEELPALAQQYGVRSVPFTVVNELTQIAGVVTEAEFVEKIIQCGVRQQADSAPAQT